MKTKLLSLHKKQLLLIKKTIAHLGPKELHKVQGGRLRRIAIDCAATNDCN